MSDDLRTRIAAVAQNHVRCDECTFAKTPEQRYLHFADAVIAALGLRRESNQAESGMDEMGVTYRTEGRHRYVTEWQPDE